MVSFFDHPYYIWNKTSLSLLGIWPEQSLFMRCLLPPIVFFFLMGLSTQELIRLPALRHDIDIFLETLTPICVGTMSATQLINGSLNREKFKLMLEHITADWNRYNKSPNVEILHKYAAGASYFVKMYLCYLQAACVFYILTPLLVPMLVDIIQPKNKTKENFYFFEAEYGVNQDDYYAFILVHMAFIIFLSIVVILSNDAMFFMLVEHACALFTITGENLKMVNKNRKNTDKSSREDNSYEMICRCMILHKEALLFAELIESCYTFCFVVVIGICLLILSLSGLQTIMHLNEPEQVLRYGSFSIAQMFHLYFNSIPGQKIIDYSSSIFDYAYLIDWSDLPPKAQKLLIIIMLRSRRSCQITAGKIYIVSMENFSAVMQTSMSFFTVLSSMR